MSSAEYTAAREGTAVVEVPGRGILAVTGPQRIKFLHNIVSSDLQSRGPGQGTLAAVMDVKGRLLALMRALVTEDAVLLEMPADRLDVIEALLVHYKVAAPVRFARRPVERGHGHFAHYGLPVDAPVDRHKWFFSYTEARDFILAQAARRVRYPGERYFNRYVQTIWAVMRKPAPR